jgi:hypothetical protein
LFSLNFYKNYITMHFDYNQGLDRNPQVRSEMIQAISHYMYECIQFFVALSQIVIQAKFSRDCLFYFFQNH